MKWLTLVAVTALIIGLSVSASAQLLARKLVLNETVTGPALVVLDSSYFDGFKSLYVSDVSDCSHVLPTWFTTNSTSIYILFNGTGTSIYYVCYGDVSIPELDLFTYHKSVYLETSVNTSTELYEASPGTWLYPGQSWEHDFGQRVHIVNSTVSGYVYAPGQGYLRIYMDGLEIASRYYNGFYGTDSLSTGAANGTVYKVYANNLYFRIDNVRIYYRPFASNSSSTSLDLSGYNFVYAEVNGLGVNVSGESYGPLGKGYLVLSPLGGTLGSSSGEDRLGPWGGGTLGFWVSVYGYEARVSGTARVLAVNASVPGVEQLGPSYLVQQPSGGGGSAGNTTIVVSYDYKPMYRVAGMILGLLGLGVIVGSIVAWRLDVMVAAAAASVAGGIVLGYGGEYKIGHIVVLAGIAMTVIGVLLYYLTFIARRIL